MHITLTRDALFAGASQVKDVVETRNTIPILANTLLDVSAAGATLRGTDLDIEITAPLLGAVEMQPGAVTLPAITLFDIARKIPADSKVTLEASGDRATLRAGRSRFVLPLQPAEDFPSLNAGEATFAFDLAGPAMLGALERVAFAISTEETRYYLNGIYMHYVDAAFSGGEGPRLRFVATDGHRLALAELPAPEGSAAVPGIIIPRKAVAQLRKLGKDSDTVRLSGSTSKLRAEFQAGAIIVTKLIDGTFPDYGRVIPAGNQKVAGIDLATLIAAVDRVGTVASERGRAVKFDFDSGRLTLTVTNPDSGEAVEELEADYSADQIIAGFNGKYVLELLANVGANPSGRIEIALQDPGSPALIRVPDATDSLSVLMPMRV